MKDGGPAFPICDFENGTGGTRFNSEGMSLRDYFAAHQTEWDLEWARLFLKKGGMQSTPAHCRGLLADLQLREKDEAAMIAQRDKE